MKILPLLVVFYLLLHTSCSNPFDDMSHHVSYPDTTVMINSLSPQVSDFKVADTDSSYHITSYWTDKVTGRIIYKMSYDPYKYSRLHGTQMQFNDRGDTLLLAHFSEGIRIDSTVYKYPNGQVKQKYIYSPKQNGNILFEMNYHPNGVRKSDVIAYNNGLINGAVTYYDDTERNLPTETYFYVNSEIVGIKIYNEGYDELQRRKDGLLVAYQRDSARLAEQFLAEGDTEFDPENAKRVIETEGGVIYDVGPPNTWDIMEVDPNFILKLE